MLKRLSGILAVLLLFSLSLSAFAAGVDISGLTLDELKELKADVEARIDELEGEEKTAQPASGEYPTLQKGDKNDDVKKLQQRLIELNYLSGSADGDYGGKTETAVEKFQSAAGLKVTGIADAQTQEKLYAADAPENAKNDDNKIPVWNGTEAVLVYEDKYVSITFNGFEELGWNSSDYAPKLMITNNTSKDMYFEWKHVLLDSMTPIVANSGKVLVGANGKTAFETGMKCIIKFPEYAETYDKTEVQIMTMQFILKNEKGKKLTEASLSVNCGINLSDYIHAE